MTASLMAPPLLTTTLRPGVRIGRQEPRLRSVPEYARTRGREAVDLAAAVGLVNDPWQADVVFDILAVDDYGQWCSMETCTIAQRQQGKGGIIETIELAALFLFGEKLILHSAHEYKTAQEAFLRIKALIEGSSDLTRHVKAIREANGEQQVVLMKGCCRVHPRTEPEHRLRFVARSKGSGRGFSGQRNILDEAYALTRTQLAALMPTMSAQPNPQLNQFSTVPDVDTLPETEEAVLPGVRLRAMDAVKSGVAGRLAYHDWSMEPGENPADVDLWYECNPALGIRISEDYVAAELAALGPAKFSVERLGLWPPDMRNGWLKIPEDAWNAAIDAESAAVGQVAIGVAVSADRNWLTVAVAGRRADGLRHVEIIKRELGTAWFVRWLTEVDFEVPEPDGLNRLKRLKPVAIVISPGGPAGSLLADLVNARADKVLRTPTGQQWGQASAAFYDGIAGEVAEGEDKRLVRDVRIRPSGAYDALRDAARAALPRKLGDAWAWERYEVQGDMSPLEASTLALWGFVTYGRKGVIDGDLMGGKG